MTNNKNSTVRYVQYGGEIISCCGERERESDKKSRIVSWLNLKKAGNHCHLIIPRRPKRQKSIYPTIGWK